MNLQEQISRMNEVMGIKDKIKKIFTKKPTSKDDKLVNTIADFIRENYNIEERDSRVEKGNLVYWLMPEDTIIFYYQKDYKRLEYAWRFAEIIHSWISDDRLKHLDSELMGKVFEKLYNKKVKVSQGYSNLHF